MIYVYYALKDVNNTEFLNHSLKDGYIYAEYWT